MIEDRRAVLAAEVEALAVSGGRIVNPPELLEQFRVADLGRVEPHLDRLGVTGAVPADPFVGRVGDVAAGVAHRGLQDPVDLAEGRFDAPEASGGEGGALGPVRSLSLERRRWRRVGGAVPELDHVMTPSNACANTKPASGIPGEIVVWSGPPATCLTAQRRAMAAEGHLKFDCRRSPRPGCLTTSTGNVTRSLPGLRRAGGTDGQLLAALMMGGIL